MDRPKWMPSEEELHRAIYAYTGGGDSSKLEKVHHDLWLRAQIAVLEEINPHTEQIYNKIAALRKELEG